ncbi:MAG: T3SS effector HopA1 family protein [Thermosynechococcaceae cyanobacterium MS004]|nr:T3SS effector HopA1 family protein [Thermosynechococcaceae cyanobacterium MS004]
MSPLETQDKSPIFSQVLAEMIEDIANEIQIQPNLWVSHPRFDALELSPEAFRSLQTLSLEAQNQYLRLRLGSYLYSIYDADGNLSWIEPQSEQEALQSCSPDFNKAIGVKSPFYIALHHHNTGQGYFDPGWLVLKETADGLLVTQKDGLTLHVSRDRHLSSSDQAATIGDRVAILMPRNCLEDGCYIALSDVGPPHLVHDLDTVLLLNIYFNLAPEGALALMEALTTALNPLRIPFSLNVPVDEIDCDYPDAIVLTLRKVDYHRVQPILREIYQKQQAHYRPKTPLFTKFLAPGLALAEQPLQTFTAQESFCLNRYQVVAEGLVTAWRQHKSDAAERRRAIYHSFSACQISLEYPYLNPGSEDRYGLYG